MSVKQWLLMGILALFTGTATAQTLQKVKADELAKYAATTDSVLVINFWATFCKPCVEEIPYLEKICKKYAGKKVKLLLVSLDPPADYPTAIKTFVRKKGFKARYVWFDEINADYFCPVIDKKWTGSIPATLIVNKALNYRKFFEQPFKEAEFEAVLKTALGIQ